MTPPPDEILDLLTAYALDALEPEEIARVSELLEQQPELRETLASLVATAATLPYALPDVPPPPELRQRVLDYATGRAARPTQRERTPPASGVERFQRWLLGLSSLAVAAIIAAAVGWYQYAGSQADLQRTQRALATAQAGGQQLAQVLFRSSVVAELSGTSGGGKVLRTPDGRTVLAANLPPLEADKVYQLWLIEGRNAPVSGGAFTVDQDGNGLLALDPALPVASADVFAVTAEPGPNGSPTPTLPILIQSTPTPA